MKLAEPLAARQSLREAVSSFLEAAEASGEIEPCDFKGMAGGLYTDYLAGVVAYWLADTSDEFADTTQLVDLSLGVLVQALRGGLVNRVLELGGFVLRSQMARFLQQGSGIVGVLRAEGRPVDPVGLVAMRQALTHRGPDQAGELVDGPLGMAAARLSLVDLSEAGAQPFADAAAALTFNGEIYNHRALAEELAADGITFRGHSDTEVLFHALRRWGVEATLPRDGRLRAIRRPRPIRSAIWPSWPHRCPLPGTVDRWGASDTSSIGKASSSARNSTVGPGSVPSNTAATP